MARKTGSKAASARGKPKSSRAAAGSERPGAWTLYRKYFTHGSWRPSTGFDLRLELDVASKIDEGVSTDAVFDAITSGVLEPNLVYQVVVPRRTLTHRKAKDQRLSPDESDRLARVLRVHARVEDALGSRERAGRWFHKPNRALSGRVPIELLASDAGARAVERVIGRIEHGVFS